MLQKLIDQFHKVVCRIKGHKLKVISKDTLWECERCKAWLIRKDLMDPPSTTGKLPLASKT